MAAGRKQPPLRALPRLHLRHSDWLPGLAPPLLNTCRSVTRRHGVPVGRATAGIGPSPPPSSPSRSPSPAPVAPPALEGGNVKLLARKVLIRRPAPARARPPPHAGGVCVWGGLRPRAREGPQPIPGAGRSCGPRALPSACARGRRPLPPASSPALGLSAPPPLRHRPLPPGSPTASGPLLRPAPRRAALGR